MSRTRKIDRFQAYLTKEQIEKIAKIRNEVAEFKNNIFGTASAKRPSDVDVLLFLINHYISSKPNSALKQN